MLRKFPILIFIIITHAIYAQPALDLSYYLPQDIQYNPDIPTPKSIIGHEVGEWHVTHDRLVYYMKALAESSDRVTIEETGRTYEGRPQLLLTITTPENQKNIEEIRQKHLLLSDKDKASGVDIENMPVVIWMGYSIHGNEPSGANASLAVAYYLAAAQGEEIESALSNSVILFDPSYNPDGLNRFATWVNMHKGKTEVSDENTRELNEVWPGGRTNHYWFDLNRDWLYVQHPESRNRVKKFQEWMPNILTDHHEMGSNSTFFFQPGALSRVNPNTPLKNFELTKKIGQYHVEALDGIQSLYFSEENYDDFYYGKGSTYPDVQGSIGILFEQASSRGHAHDSDNGVLRFPFTIRNHVTTALSTFKAGIEMRKELLEFQQNFYAKAVERADADPVKAIVYGSSDDAAKNYHFTKILLQHKVDIYEVNEDFQANGKTFEKGSSYLIPLNQSQYSLIKGVFSTQTKFADSLFYDISAWTLPYTFNLPYAELGKGIASSVSLGDKVTDIAFKEGEVIGGTSTYAYAFDWDGYYAPRTLYKLLEKGIKAQVTTNPFSAKSGEKQHAFTYGSILIPLGIQDLSADEIYTLISKVSKEDGVDFYAINSGYASTGSDLGSRNFLKVEKPRTMLMVGDGVRSYEAGEVWHLMDERFEMPISLVETADVNRIDLSTYNKIVMVSGSYSSLSSSGIEKLKSWVRAGNTLILIKGAVSWANNNGLVNLEFVKGGNSDKYNTRPYANYGNDRGAKVTGGAIFSAKLDITHPLGYGYRDEVIPIFRSGNMSIRKHENPYATPLIYTDAPLLSGYVHPDNYERIKGSAGILIDNLGRGKVISMVDNPNFRAFWYGTNKLFFNALYFGNIISSGTAR
ncbi:M14 family zinc carboxypeptidase [Chondrinema litorale]|uniref:M14 family zinc carboxypeptidase n=1 Tax=Chondrinema litorale TaxID=2994555 RepID=UPI002542C985|nr:M14 family zinc carboxypeptidase [Chondrinema litorale]UZR93387.1 M14 family zinc carboxypeptidase [Chondrinema litorale]